MSLRSRVSLGPLALLTVFTSVAFNRAVLARAEAEAQRNHLVQCNLLQEEIRRLQSQSANNTSSRGWFGRRSQAKTNPEERRSEDVALARRCITIGLDPRELGIPNETIPFADLSTLGSSDQITWKQVLFGSGQKTKGDGDQGVWEKMRKGIDEAGKGLKATFGSGKAGSQIEEGDEESRALEAALMRMEAADQEARPVKRQETQAVVRDESVTPPTMVFKEDDRNTASQPSAPRSQINQRRIIV